MAQRQTGLPPVESLLLYDFSWDSILGELTGEEGSPYQAARELLDFAGEYGLSGNLWQAYIAHRLAEDVSAFSLACERGTVSPSLRHLAGLDAQLLYRLFHAEPREIPQWPVLRAYDGGSCGSPTGARLMALRDLLAGASDAESFLNALEGHYRSHGAAPFGLADALRAVGSEDGCELVPIEPIPSASFDDLIGLNRQKAQICENTEAFLKGRAFNHMLLYGDAGTGKSTSVKALLNAYRDQGLRLIELKKEQMHLLVDVARSLTGRALKFLVFIDDLSFEEHETGYKYLKAAIEGGMEELPDNMMLCVTSNRRHLIRETWKDRSDMEYDGDVHRSDTLEEKLSLAGRFGCAINFSVPDRRGYHEIVKGLLARAGGTDLTESQLLTAANTWEIRHGGVSGRTARQFVNHLTQK